ncbi:MAG TPA: LLM class F420-dependent oxidoreductase [Actinomycetota bacterium]|nr:LLM class F420-dependent oxidoreductase [Actinomycetota bacterium]
MTVTRFGLQIPDFTFPEVADKDLFETVAGIAETAERSGFDSIWVMDHLYQIGNVGPETDPMLEAYTLLGALAARTSKASLGTMVTGVTYRNPALLAKQVTTLDIISSGRAILGIGAAWNESEHLGYGFAFPPVRERLDRLEEALQICRAMFTQERATFAGRHYQTNEALNYPRPVRSNGIPILVGGGGEKRTLRLVAQYADACNFFGDLPGIKHKIEVLARHCEEVGRDPAEITKTRLGGLMIAATASEAEAKGELVRERRNMPRERYDGYFVAGDPDAVAEQVNAYLDAGLDGLIFNVHDAADLERVELAGKTLSSIA